MGNIRIHWKKICVNKSESKQIVNKKIVNKFYFLLFIAETKIQNSIQIWGEKKKKKKKERD